jgi:predicted RNA-binding Zn-ribbon protein involved in translation (DUF1610 family)
VAGDRYTQPVPFRCPGCDASLAARPERFAQRCPACGALIRSRALDSDGELPAYEVYVAGRRETLRRVEVPWDEPQRRRLAAWLLWSSSVTLGLVLVLLLLARLLR